MNGHPDSANHSVRLPEVGGGEPKDRPPGRHKAILSSTILTKRIDVIVMDCDPVVLNGNSQLGIGKVDSGHKRSRVIVNRELSNELGQIAAGDEQSEYGFRS